MPSFLNIYFSHESAYKLESLGTGSTNVVKPTGEIKALRSGSLILVSVLTICHSSLSVFHD